MNDKKTLLEIARSYPKGRFALHQCTEEESDLVIAYLYGEISHLQLKRALGVKSNPYQYLATIIASGVKQGLIKITRA